MNLEQQVISLELSRRLNELGIKQESLFYWYGYSEKDKSASICYTKGKIIDNDCYSAFTASELLDLLPTDVCVTDENGSSWHYQLWVIKTRHGYVVTYYSSDDNSTEEWQEENDTLANCLAKMLIKVTENGFLKLACLA